jgi:hypothetical protein
MRILIRIFRLHGGRVLPRNFYLGETIVKKLLLLICILALTAITSLTVSAQQAGTIPGLGPSSSWPSPDEIVAKLDQQLALSDAQKAKLTPIITQRQEQLKALESDTSRPAVRAHKFEFIYRSSELRINQVLNKQQKAKYAEMEREMRNQATHRQQQRRPNNAAHP